jgi:hypothetical protein
MKNAPDGVVRRLMLVWSLSVLLGSVAAGWPRPAYSDQLAGAPTRPHPIVGASAPRASGYEYGRSTPFCEQHEWLCTDSNVNQNGKYVGHDEPSVLFYSSSAGSGNSMTYTITLPKDPPTLPKQDGSGGTFNFQLHPAFWFGMAMCDTQSAPEFTNTCTPDSDSNIFDNSNPAAPDYIGNHPGTAFMEMQFYPPRWATLACDATHWCAALTIDSLNFDQNNDVNNNTDCLNKVGREPINFAYITKSGVADSPADPLISNNAKPNPATDLLFNPGDSLIVTMNDTPQGVKVAIQDLTTGGSGSMTASTANGFAQVVFAPSSSVCSSRAYAFHPMYATSSEHTRVPWAAHSYNTSFADEIGHFEFCDAIDVFGNCTVPGIQDPVLDIDDTQCSSTFPPLIPLIGCTATESDFDGVPYQPVWPGANTNTLQDKLFHPSPVLFSSPVLRGSDGLQKNYDRVAFEADLPAIEQSVGCDRSTGAGCTNPPPGANFYPFFTTGASNGRCAWQLGGAHIVGTTNTFGGSSTSEFGALLQLVYPTSSGPVSVFNDYRKVLSNNPCAVAVPHISIVPASVKAGSSFTLTGNGFTNGSVVNFFVSTAPGPDNAGPFTPSVKTPTELTVMVPASVSQGEGFVDLEVVNKDQGFVASNKMGTLLQGLASAGLPTITKINGKGLDPTSIDPQFAVNNVNTILDLGVPQTIDGTGFDVKNGVAVDLFCACPGGKAGPFFLNPGDPGLTSTRITITLPNSGPKTPVVGPGSLRVDNNGGDNSYSKQSNAVAVPIGAAISISKVSLVGGKVTVDGTGFSPLTIINFFNAQGGGVVNLGGLSGGNPVIHLSLNSPNQFTFPLPAGAMPGRAYVQAINPPFLPYTGTGTSPAGDLTIP